MAEEVQGRAAVVEGKEVATPVKILVLSSSNWLEGYSSLHLSGEARIGNIITFEFDSLRRNLRPAAQEKCVTVVVVQVLSMKECAEVRALKCGSNVPILAMGNVLQNRFLRASLEKRGIPCFTGSVADCLGEIAIMVSEWISTYLLLTRQPYPYRNGQVDFTTLMNLIRYNAESTMFSNN